MAVKIEVLDYKFGEFEGTQMIANNTFATSTDWNTGAVWTIAGGKATHSGLAGYLTYNNVTFIEGKNYRIKYTISGRSQGHFRLANHLANGANGFSQHSNGTFEYDWVQGSSNTTRLRLWGSDVFDGSVEDVNVYPINGIDWKNSIVGSLDVTDHSDFPLALTFQISDIRDITATSGDYSKTFKIPATKNNNNIFHQIYDPQTVRLPNFAEDISSIIANKKSATREMPCRILINDFYSIVGTLRVKSVGIHGKTPDYYDCVFLGNNLGWAKSMGDAYINEIDWGSASEGLSYNKAGITATWQYEDSDAAETASAAPIVYPVVSYGNYNVGGDQQQVQLFDTKINHFARNGTVAGGASYAGYDNSNNSFGTLPQADWRPAIFVKTTLEKIFDAQGYTISSNFMNTSMFKKLVWLLPNFKRNNDSSASFYELNSFESKPTNGVSSSTNSIAISGTNPSDPTGANHNGVPFDTVITENIVGSRFFNPITVNNESGGTNYPEKYLTGDGRVQLNISATNLNVTLEETTTLGSNVITIGAYGYYTITLKGLMSRVARAYRATGTGLDLNEVKSAVNIEVQTIGQTSWNILASSEETHEPHNYDNDEEINDVTPSASGYKSQPDITVGTEDAPLFLNTGDKIRLTLGGQITQAEDDDSDFYWYHFFAAKSSSEFKIQISQKTIDFGQTYNLSDVIEPNQMQIDFIKGIAHAFNLRISTNQTEKVVTIEPFDDFYEPYKDAIDWTSKLDRSKQTNDKWVKNNIKRNIVFKYKTDSKDAMIKHRGFAYFKEVEDEYPYIEELPREFERGDSVFENPFFAGTFNTRDFDTQGGYTSDPLYSACLWEVKSSGATGRGSVPKGFDFQPRLLYWNKYSPTTTHDAKFIKVQTWANGFTDTLIADDSVVIPTPPSAAGSGWLGGIMPQATSIDRYSTSSPVLSYGNVWRKQYNASTNAYGSAEAGKGLYDTYYKNMFEMAKSNPRVRVAYFDLKVSDIVNLDFRKLVYIDGVYWRVDKIIDYFPNNNNPTKVELVQWLELGAFAASAPAFGVGSSSPENGGVSIYAYGTEINPNDNAGNMVNSGG